jgi:hypothetical protein
MNTDDKEEKGLAALAGSIEDENDDAIMPDDDSAEKARWLFRSSGQVTIH